MSATRHGRGPRQQAGSAAQDLEASLARETARFDSDEGCHATAAAEAARPRRGESLRTAYVEPVALAETASSNVDMLQPIQEGHAPVSALRLYGRTRPAGTSHLERAAIPHDARRSERLAQRLSDVRLAAVEQLPSVLVAAATALLAYLYRVGESRTVVLAIPMRAAAEPAGPSAGELLVVLHVDEGETFAALAAKVQAELLRCLRHIQPPAQHRNYEYASLESTLALAAVGDLPVGSGTSALAGARDPRNVIALTVRGELDHESSLPGETAGLGSTLELALDTALFSGPLFTRAQQHFVALLDALLDDLDTPIDAVYLLGEEEQLALLELGRGAEHAAPPQDPIARLLQTAAAQPDRPALVFGESVLTYGELVAQLGALASELRERGVQTGSRVGICVQRGPDELLAMLATWAAGGIYVPLDPTHPAERIRMILEDATPDVLVTHADVVSALDVPAAVSILLLDQERPRVLARAPYVQTEVSADQLAYILFTSGSTGRPKGVSISRRAFSNFLRSMAHTPGMTRSDRLLAVTTITFDIAGLELHLPLWVGGSVQVADRETVLDPVRLRSVLETQPITIMQATPTAWRLLIEAGYEGGTQRLRMLCGGEPMSPELSRSLTRVGELWNMYGPTETTVWSTLKQVLPEQKITVGRPIDHTQIYVLDAQGQLLPEGLIGELCIGGLGVAAGYLARPELTAEKFVQNRYAEQTDIVYRTGDLARWLPDGDLDCLGRVDHQVKIRGFRIELGEIESCLRGVDGVRDAVVTALHSGAGEPRLVAYWVGSASEPELTSRARTLLPAYMHPAAYVRLEQMPLNTNGKVDRKQLPAPSVSAHAVVAEGELALTDREGQMAALFEEVLGHVQVPVDRDFFELGGDSVRAIKLRRRIHEVFGIELPLGILFDRPTVRRLVEALSPSLDPMQPAFVPLRRGRPDLPPVLCIYGVTLYRPLAEALSTEASVYGLHIPYKVHVRGDLPRLEELAGRYLELILEQAPSDSYHLVGLCFGGLVAYELARQLKQRGRGVGVLALLDAPLLSAARFSLRHGVATLAAETRKDPSRLTQVGAAALTRVKNKVSWYLADKLHARSDDAEIELDVASPYADQIALRYELGAPRFDGPVTVFRAEERDDSRWRPPPRDLGWSQLASRVESHPVGGTHLGMVEEPHVRQIAAVLSAQLETRESR
jgi:amino acid adenylation domain-containing protein